MARRECSYLKCERKVAVDVPTGATLGLCKTHARQADRVLNSPRLARPEYEKRRKENTWLYQ